MAESKKQFLDIPPRSRRSELVWEHVLKSVLAFAGTFSLTYFGPLLLGGRRGRHLKEVKVEILRYVIEHPEFQLAACAGAVLLYNLAIVRKNSKKVHVVGIDLDEGRQRLTFRLASLYSNKQLEVTKDLSEVRVEEGKEGHRYLDHRKIIKFKSGGKSFARIVPRWQMWGEHSDRIRACLREIERVQGVA